MDPKTGMIDINILTTGLSITDRKRRVDAAKALLELVKGKGRVATLNYYKLFEEFREQAEAVSCFHRPFCFFYGSLVTSPRRCLKVLENIGICL